jgi:hypothetical protein
MPLGVGHWSAMPGRALKAGFPRRQRFHDVVEANRGKTTYGHEQDGVPDRILVPELHSPFLCASIAALVIHYLQSNSDANSLQRTNYL